VAATAATREGLPDVYPQEAKKEKKKRRRKFFMTSLE